MAISRFLTALVFLLGAATVTASGFNVTTLAFDEGYSHLFGEGNLVRSPDGRTVRLVLNRYSGDYSSPSSSSSSSSPLPSN